MPSPECPAGEHYMIIVTHFRDDWHFGIVSFSCTFMEYLYNNVCFV